ncbi:hypothetical protein [Streptomyces chartreusis]|uniref:hypothetical protein n=1 Tax=Streptomyces chartreusis TaxID=1969 RepID=UPI0036AA8C73
MTDEDTTIPIQQRYAPQLAADLEKNLAAQERLRTEERWLRATLKSLPTLSDLPQEAPGAPEATPEPEPSRTAAETPIPPPRGEESRPPAASARKAARSKGGTKAPAAKATTRKSTTAGNTSRKSGGPTLGGLVLAVLNNNPGEPRTAAEVTEDLAREYPERARDTNNVRNALEGLVAKSLIERSKQKNTVHYTVQGQQPLSDQDRTAAEPPPAAETAAIKTAPVSA